LASKRVYGHDFGGANAWTNVTLTFTNPKPQIMEFRGVECTQGCEVSLDFLEVKQTTATSYSSEVQFFDFSHFKLDSGRIINNSLVHIAKDRLGFFWHGPYVSMNPGTYRAVFWYRPINNILQEHELYLDVSANFGDHVIALASLPADSSRQVNVWRSFEFNFQLDQAVTQVEFRGAVQLRNSEIAFSNVELIKTSEIEDQG
jgi:hypothetical protein